MPRPGRAVLTASSAMEYAFDGGALTRDDGNPSVFTSALVQGLRTGAADRDGDGLISVEELYDYVYQQVRAQTPSQTPHRWSFDIEGDLFIATAAHPPATDLATDLQAALASPFPGARLDAVTELTRLLTGRHRGLAAAAHDALERLRDEDDSFRVRLAATAALTSHEQRGQPSGETVDARQHQGGSTRITITALPYSPLVTHHLAVTGLATVRSRNRRVVLASVGVDGMARLWDPRTGARVGLPANGETGPFAALVTVPVPNSPLLLAAGGKDGGILVWNPWAGPEGMRLIDRAGRVRAIAGVVLSSVDVLLASGGEDGVRLWDPRTCKLVLPPEAGPGGDTSGSAEKGYAEAAAVHALAAVATPQGVLLGGGGVDGTVRLWDPRTGAPVGLPMTGHDGPVSALAAVATPQGVLLAGGGVDGTVRLWDPRTGAPVGSPMTGHDGPVSALAVVPLPDGRVLLATGSADKTVGLWDPVTGRPAGEPLTGHTDWVRAVAAVPLPDGRVLLASGGLDGAVRLWELVE
jgi:WD40 repeat protein